MVSVKGKVFGKIKKILSEEWREDVDEIVSELREQKSAKDKVKFVHNKEAEP